MESIYLLQTKRTSSARRRICGLRLTRLISSPPDKVRLFYKELIAWQFSCGTQRAIPGKQASRSRDRSGSQSVF